MKDLKSALFYFVGVVVAFLAHEVAQARTAAAFGDDTPRRHGRVSLNPVVHADPLGTYILPGLLLLLVASGGGFPPFAYGKPMPLVPSRMRDPSRDEILTLLAGPAADLALAAVFALALRVAPGGDTAALLAHGMVVCIVFAVFNLMPIPPLDGSKILAHFLPPRAGEVMDQLQVYGGLFMIAVFFLIGGPVLSIVHTLGNGVCRVLVGTNCF